MTISDAEHCAWHTAAAHAAANARARIHRQLAGVDLDENDRVFIARLARDGDPDGLLALLAKLRAGLTPPPGVTVDRYHVNANPVPADAAYDTSREVWVERVERTGHFVISNGTWSYAPLWNFTLGDWCDPWADDSYDESHLERPEAEALAKARQIVGLDEPTS